jgi:ATP-dependent DNA ligase
MFGFCRPTAAKAVPSGPDWLHEIKYDGFRLLVRRQDKRVRLLTMNGYDFTDRYPWIVEAARKIRRTSFVIDGEAVVLGIDGVSDFDALWSQRHDEEVQLCAFDILMEDGEDLRKVPLHLRKDKLDRVLARRPEGIFVNPYERGAIGPDLFEAACDLGLEGLVSKHRDRPYQSGRSKHWIKVKNRKHPAMERVMDALS